MTTVAVGDMADYIIVRPPLSMHAWEVGMRAIHGEGLIKMSPPNNYDYSRSERDGGTEFMMPRASENLIDRAEGMIEALSDEGITIEMECALQ